MSLRRRLMQRWLDHVGPRTTGFPTSSNGAASSHLRWLGLPHDAPLIEVSVTLEVAVPPAVAHLYFWALQVSFVDGSVSRGAGHLGLQWYPAHPGSTAANWGGYAAGGHELTGTTSTLPSATGNPNTRDLRWEAERPYRLTVRPGSVPGRWQGCVDGQVIRELDGGGTSLTDVMVWSEVFAPCDAPPTVVRWSDLSVRTLAGTARPDRLAVSYQSAADGGCDNTSVRIVDGGAEQRTNVGREHPPGTVLPC